MSDSDAAEALRAALAECDRLRQDRDSFHMDYRMKCDVETKALHVERESLRAEIERLREGVSAAQEELRLCQQDAINLQDENERLRQLLNSYRLAVRGIPRTHLTAEFYGSRDWAANLIHLRQSDLEEVQ